MGTVRGKTAANSAC
nr:hypothetical protein [Escherichia coli]